MPKVAHTSVTLTDDEERNALMSCPIIRMGKVTPTFVNGYVIQPQSCIGCGICAKKNSKIKMIDW